VTKKNEIFNVDNDDIIRIAILYLGDDIYMDEPSCPLDRIIY